ncbi:hypothetical protein ES288_A11G163500v1 [Gossypium darwinii]|uniref:Uncharacterized protein n=1 Tax=Gossypium darwinii TaxID=34276 RepID=A0A5D2EKD6_GOSDA|nr:hypothetical protein ES288_A11G163500v1 [Gossypium darwinii]
MLFVSKNLHDFKASQLLGWVADRIDSVNQIMEKYLRYVYSASITHLNLIFFFFCGNLCKRTLRKVNLF